MSSQPTSYRQLLNNELQGRRSLSYDYAPHGPLHEQIWIAVANIDGVEYGRGEGLTRAEAKEKASMNAYLQFVRQSGA